MQEDFKPPEDVLKPKNRREDKKGNAPALYRVGRWSRTGKFKWAPYNSFRLSAEADLHTRARQGSRSLYVGSETFCQSRAQQGQTAKIPSARFILSALQCHTSS